MAQSLGGTAPAERGLGLSSVHSRLVSIRYGGTPPPPNAEMRRALTEASTTSAKPPELVVFAGPRRQPVRCLEHSGAHSLGEPPPRSCQARELADVHPNAHRRDLLVAASPRHHAGHVNAEVHTGGAQERPDVSSLIEPLLVRALIAVTLLALASGAGARPASWPPQSAMSTMPTRACMPSPLDS